MGESKAIGIRLNSDRIEEIKKRATSRGWSFNKWINWAVSLRLTGMSDLESIEDVEARQAERLEYLKYLARWFSPDTTLRDIIKEGGSPLNSLLPRRVK